MAVTAIGKYEFEPRDARKNFHGNIIVYLHWIDHLMFCAPVTIPFPPEAPFGAIFEALAGVYSYHPEWEDADLSVAEWTLDGEPFVPDTGKGLEDQGIGHKSVITFTTPGLKGLNGAGI